jgi:hypothetical protein
MTMTTTNTYQLDAQQWNGTIDAACGAGARREIESVSGALSLLRPYLGAGVTAVKWDSGEYAFYSCQEDADHDDTGDGARALMTPESMLRDRE